MHVSFGLIEGHAAVVADGVLDLRTAPRLREALLKASAEQPPALVCDLRGATADTYALTVLLTVADTVQHWPSMPLIILSGETGMARRLAAIGVDLRLCVTEDPAELGPLVRRSPSRLQTSTRLPADTDAASRARLLVGQHLQRWHVAHRADEAGLIADELVGNAVAGTGRPCTLRLSLTGTRLGISVADDGAQTPGGHLRPPDGLATVRRLSDRWGVFPRLGGGRVTWALLGGHGGGYPAVPRQSRTGS